MKQTVVEIIVNQIIDGLKQGNIPRKKTWITRGQKNIVTKQGYKGFNQILLSFIAGERERSSYWCSYKQAEALGGNVKQGEVGTRIVYYKMTEKIEEKDGKKEKKLIPVLRYFTVFNLSQIEGIEIPNDENKVVEMNMELKKDIETYLRVEKIRLCQGDPAYDILFDSIDMPYPKHFTGLNEYRQTFFHEICHSTGAKDRLDRNLQKQDMKEYSKEELVAEIGASILMNENGLEWNKTNTQAYINGWIKLLEEKPQAIISAGNKAFQAVEFYLSKISKNA